MKLHRIGLLLASAGMFAQPIAAQSEVAVTLDCATLQGQTITPVDADALAASIGKRAQPRGEFESTEQYRARMASVGGAVPDEVFVSIPLETKYITYDADAAEFVVQSFALDNRNASWEALADVVLPWDRSRYVSNYVDVVTKFAEQTTGTYKASNAYGATMTVRQISRDTVGILERPAKGSEDLFFPDRPWTSERSNVVARIRVDPASAPAWRSQLKAAVLISPQPPYIAHGTKEWGRATFDRPSEVSESLTAIIADIRCAVLTDAHGKVITGIATR